MLILLFKFLVALAEPVAEIDYTKEQQYVQGCGTKKQTGEQPGYQDFYY